MSRSRASRFASVVLLLLAGSVEPAWEIGHTVAHAKLAHHAHELSEFAPAAADPAFPAVSALPDGDEHSHPIFQAPVRPPSDLILPVTSLPSKALGLQVGDLPVRRLEFPGISARGSPRTAGTTRSRAPPLA